MSRWGRFDLWDSNPLLACCTVPIGYHPSVYGDYLNALMLFGQITGINPLWISTEYSPFGRDYRATASHALGISPEIAGALALVAQETLVAGGPVTGQTGQLCWEQKWAACRRPPGWHPW